MAIGRATAVELEAELKLVEVDAFVDADVIVLVLELLPAYGIHIDIDFALLGRDDMGK